MSMSVAELFASLGLKVEKKDFDAGKEAIASIHRELQSMAVAAEIARIKGLGMGMDVGKALANVGFPATTKLTTGMERLAKAGRFATTMYQKLAVAAGSFFALSKIKDTVKSVADTGGKINDTAQQIGIGAQALQAWGHAAKLNGSSLDGFATSAKKLAKNLYDIGTGKGDEARVAFRKLGISLDEPAIKAKDTSAVFMLLASRMQLMPDGAEKTAIAMALMGKSGSEMIPTLNSGVAALQKLKQSAIDTGLAMSDKDVAGLDAFGDQLQDAEDAMQGLKNQAVAAMLPALKSLIAGFIAWTKANRDVIRSGIESAVKTLVVVLRTLGTVLAFVVDHWRAFAVIVAAGTVVSGILAVIRVIVFFQTAAVAAATKTAVAWLLMMGPVLALALLFTALGVLIYIYRDRVRAALQRVGDYFRRLGSRVAGTARDVVSFFVSVGVGIKNAISDAIDFAIAKVKGFANTVRNLPVIKQLGDAGEWIQGKISGNTVDPSDAFSQARAMGDTRDRAAFEADQEANRQRFYGAQRGGGTTRDVASKAANASVSTSYQLNINAPDANAQDVAKMVDQKIREQQERDRRQLAAFVGAF